MGNLNNELEKILDASLSANTRRTYNVGVRNYEWFCRQSGLTPFPPTEDTLMLFVTSSYKRIGHKSIKVYLAGIKYASCMQGYTINLVTMHRLYYTLRGVRRLQGNSFIRPRRSPITLALLAQLHEGIQQRFQYHDALMIKAASLIAFYGLLRASEYLTSNFRHYEPSSTLLVEDITFSKNHSHANIHIKQSKTDPFRQGCTITIWANNGRLCPVTTLRWFYIQCYHSGPLFTFQDGTYLTREKFSSIIHLCLPNINLNTHSFRIGGASTAYAAGISETTIKILGRWSSDAYRLYIHCPDETIQHAHKVMSQTLNCTPWYPREEQGEGCPEE
jgi:hypothetical protein